MHEINLIDKSYSINDARNYNLTVQLNNNGLTYCVYDPTTRYFNMFRKHRFDHVILQDDLIRHIESTFEKDETLSLPFHNVRVLVYTRQSTLVPDDYFDHNQIDKYLSFNHGRDIDHSVFSNKIVSAGINNIFALPDELVSLITAQLQNAVFFNQTTPFISHITRQPDLLNKQAVYIGLNSDFFDIACSGDGKLLLYNTFQYAGDNDLLYYILFVFHSLGFDTQKIPLFVSGELSSKLSYWDMIRQYVPDTRYDDFDISASLTPALQTLTVSKFINLLNLQSCVLSEESSAEGK